MKIKKIAITLKKDYQFRAFVSASFSFLANTLFLCYNLFVGVFYRLVWNFSVSFYYLFLALVKAFILFGERKWKTEPKDKVWHKRKALYKTQNVFLLLIDVALLAPVALMLLEQKAVNVGRIATIGIAAYTTYKIVMACIHFRRVRKIENLSLQALKTIHLKETLVSIITLQNTMVTVFGEPKQMLTLTFWTSLGLWGLIMAVSIFSILRSFRLTK